MKKYELMKKNSPCWNWTGCAMLAISIKNYIVHGIKKIIIINTGNGHLEDRKKEIILLWGCDLYQFTSYRKE